MPIYRKVGQRPQAVPFQFFKGHMRDLRRMPRTSVANVFFPSVAGLAANERLKAATGIKRNVLRELTRDWKPYEGGMSSVMVELPNGSIRLRLRKLGGGKVAIYQNPVFHTITSSSLDSFETLKRIVRDGFSSQRGERNVDHGFKRQIMKEIAVY